MNYVVDMRCNVHIVSLDVVFGEMIDESTAEQLIIHQNNIDKWVAKFPNGQARSASLMALRVVQDEVGYLTPGWMSAVAYYLKVEVTKIYEVATFYGMYHHQPVGRYHLRVCNNISCCLQGSNQTLAYLKDKMGLSDQRISDDGLFSLSETECCIPMHLLWSMIESMGQLTPVH